MLTMILRGTQKRMREDAVTEVLFVRVSFQWLRDLPVDGLDRYFQVGEDPALAVKGSSLRATGGRWCRRWQRWAGTGLQSRAESSLKGFPPPRGSR